jgi:uncharacterized protein (DUF1015 family)
VSDIADIEQITEGFESLGVLYIADGHHRSAAASRVFSNRNKSGGNPNDSFLLVSFPESEVKVFEYNRLVKDLFGLSEAEFKGKVRENFNLVENSQPVKPSLPGHFSMYISGSWYSLSPKTQAYNDSAPVDRLDISILTRSILGPILGIGDPRLDPRIDFVGGIKGLVELENRVDSGDWVVAFALFPTSVQDLISVADAEEIMPPKSTWFEPKLADGMISLILY